MTPPSPSFTERLRAGMAALLARLAAGARRLEEWSARGMRPVLLGLAVMAFLVVGAFAVFGGGYRAVGWLTGDARPAHARQEWHSKSEGRFETRRGGHAAVGKPEMKPGGRAEAKPEAPRPPAPPAPPVPPPPPTP